jgi:hypothetical protein
MEDDDNEEKQMNSHHGRHTEKRKTDHRQCTFHRSLHTKLTFCVDSEKGSHPPTPPPPSKQALRDVRHWIPSTTRHVIITPEMLREQSDLDGPYNPNPFDDDPNADEEGPDGELLSPTDRNVATGASRSSARRRSTWAKVRHSVLNRGYVPLVLRLVSLIFAILAVMLAAFITRNSVKGGVETRPSTIMAFFVNAVAIFYLPWAARVFHHLLAGI